MGLSIAARLVLEVGFLRDHKTQAALALFILGACSSAREQTVDPTPIDRCCECHGNADLGHCAPPPAYWQEEPVLDPHDKHLAPSGFHRQVLCTDCHLVPSSIFAEGHIDSDLPAELSFGELATNDGAEPAFERTTCSGVYCHGATFAAGGGSNTTPDWSRADGTQATCGTCHGLPPAGDHPARMDCGSCHGAVIDDGGLFINPELHINGTVNLDGIGCDTCHGSDGNAAPPLDTLGNSTTASRGVGAHRSHLNASGWRASIECSECHIVPSNVIDEGHRDSPLPAEITWGGRAVANGAAPVFDGISCSGVYCHGSTLDAGGANTTPEWTRVDGTQAVCGNCHSIPPPPPHPAVGASNCSPCHPFEGLVPEDPELHINGVLDGSFECGSCHPVPPNTGAHAVHYGEISSEPRAEYGDLRLVTDYEPGGAPIYLFGCGNCHPIDDTKHFNGTVDIELYDATAPAGSIKALSPMSASFDGAGCTNVYCHSSGQGSPVYVATPDWVGGSFSGPRCSACHENPPRYDSGGTGTDTANSHLVMADDGYEFGHFGGLPGPWHSSYHGAASNASAPITCQTCHYDTVDPANVGPGGFYYLDTTGDYDLGGSLGYACATCHTGAAGEPATSAGAIQTAAHVNGRRDVIFDPRTAIPAEVSGLPDAPNRPSRPYWVTAIPFGGLPTDSVTDGSTWSFHLGSSGYDPVDKTCTSVPCHLNQSYPGSSTGPLTWGEVPVGNATCNACHQF